MTRGRVQWRIVANKALNIPDMSSGIKWPRRKADCTPPSSPGGQRMREAILPLSQHTFTVWCSVKAQGHMSGDY